MIFTHYFFIAFISCNTKETLPEATLEPAQALEPKKYLEGYPFARLNLPQKRIREVPIKEEDMGQKKTRAFMADNSSLLLVVYEFSDQQAAMNATTKLLAWGEKTGWPYKGDASLEGNFILVAGYPSKKLPDEKMKISRDKYLQAFSGME